MNSEDGGIHSRVTQTAGSVAENAKEGFPEGIVIGFGEAGKAKAKKENDGAKG